jgi:hypothetical protein
VTTSAQPELSFQKTVELPEVREATWFVWRRTKLGGAVIATLLGGFVGAYVGNLVVAGFWFYLPITLVFSAGVNALFCWFLITQAAKRAVARAQGVGPETWSFSDEGIAVESSESNVELKWNALRGYVETKRLLLLRVRSTYLPIPLRCLTEDQRATLLRLFENKHVKCLS